MNRPCAILFDFDGTLANLDVDWEDLRASLAVHYLGCGFRSTFQPLTSALEEARVFTQGLQREGVWRESLEIIREAERRGLANARLMPGSCELLGFLGEHKIPFAIVSSNDSRVVNEAVAKFGLPSPAYVAGRDTVRFFKPHPEGAELALKALDVQASECWLVGDGEQDLQLGQAIGSRTFIIPGATTIDGQAVNLNGLGDLIALLEGEER